LEILGSTEAIRILFDGTRAVGVQVERNGQQEVIRADNVVVSAGAIKSPQLLQLSGVGPAGELKRLGIPVVSDLSGVGGNLQDHPCIPLLATAAQPDPEHHGFRLYGRFSSTEGTNDLAFCHGQMAVSAINFPVDTAAPDIVFFTAILGKPTSRGWVKVNSTNHLEPPEIHLNFLGTEDDVARIKQAYQVIARAVERGTLNSALAGVIVPSRDVYGDSLVDWLGTTEADAYLRQVVITSYHAAGTCAMGPDPAQGAVVDDKLRVHGTEGLYVVDASVMPTITNGMTHLSTSMIGHHFVTLFNEGRENSTESHAMAQG
jgi:choline dehydrogenase